MSADRTEPGAYAAVASFMGRRLNGHRHAASGRNAKRRPEPVRVVGPGARQRWRLGSRLATTIGMCLCLVSTVRGTEENRSDVEGQVEAVAILTSSTTPAQRGAALDLADYLTRETGTPHRVLEEPGTRAAQLLDRSAFSLAILPPIRYVDLAANRLRRLARGDRVPSVRLLGRFEKQGASRYSWRLYSAVPDCSLSEVTERSTLYYYAEDSASGFVFPLALLSAEGVRPHLHLVRDATSPIGLLRFLLGGGSALPKGALIGTWDGAIEVARSQRIPLATLCEVHRAGLEIPYDTVVALRDPDDADADETEAKVRRAIGLLFTAGRKEVDGVFDRSSQISGLRQADDEDYDGVRRAQAIRMDAPATETRTRRGSRSEPWRPRSRRGSSSPRLVRFGLSLALAPHTEATKRMGWRVVQQNVYAIHGRFLDIRTYREDQAGEMIRALLNGELDVAELPPLAVGEALEEGQGRLRVIALPTFNVAGSTQDHVTSAVVRRRDLSLRGVSARDLVGLTIGLGPSASASTSAFPLMHLAQHSGRSARAIAASAVRFGDQARMIDALASGAIDLAVVTDFDGGAQRPSSAALVGTSASPPVEVEVIDGGIVSVPFGGYVAALSPENSATESGAERATNLGRLLVDASQAIGQGGVSPDRMPAAVLDQMPRLVEPDEAVVGSMQAAHLQCLTVSGPRVPRRAATLLAGSGAAAAVVGALLAWIRQRRRG